MRKYSEVIKEGSQPEVIKIPIDISCLDFPSLSLKKNGIKSDGKQNY